MFEAFIIVLREGFEAFLIVAITLAYLGRTGRKSLAAAVYAGTGAAVIASLALGWVLMRGANLPLWEGVLGLVALRQAHSTHRLRETASRYCSRLFRQRSRLPCLM